MDTKKKLALIYAPELCDLDDYIKNYPSPSDNRIVIAEVIEEYEQYAEVLLKFPITVTVFTFVAPICGMIVYEEDQELEFCSYDGYKLPKIKLSGPSTLQFIKGIPVNEIDWTVAKVIKDEDNLKQFEIKPGDKVKVIDPGKNFSTYNIAKVMGRTEEDIGLIVKFAYGDLLMNSSDKEHVFKVIKFFNNDKMAIIEDCSNEKVRVIEKDGLKSCHKAVLQ